MAKRIPTRAARPRAVEIEITEVSTGLPAAAPPPPSGLFHRRSERSEGESAGRVRAQARRDDWSGERVPLLAGRALFGGYFLYNGINHFRNHSMMSGYAQSKGVPLPGAAVAGSGALLVAGGLSLLMGTRPRLGASLITTFLLGVSPVMHAFWKEEDQTRQMQEMVNFTKNMALVGGAALAAALPAPWPWAISYE